MRVRTYLRTGAVLAALSLALAACGGDDTADEATGTAETGTEETDASATGTATAATGTGGGEVATGDLSLINDGTLTVCSDAPYSPFEVEDPEAPSGYSGFDIDLMQAMAEQLDLQLEVKDLGFDAIQSGAALGADQCDIAASAMTINEEREQNVDFTDPYFDADQSLLVKQDSDISTLEDLAGSTLGVQADTTGQEYAEANAPDDVQLREFPDAAALFAALEAGQINGILQDLPVNADRVQQDDSIEIVETYTTGEQYGFAVKEEGKEELLEAINQSLDTLRENGTYDDLYQQYFGETPESA